MKQLFGRTRPARPGAPRSPAPSENARGVDLSAKIEPFPYTNAPPVITPTQQRNLANMGSLAPATDLRSDPLMTAPERRQSLRARESSDEPWVMINDSIQNPDSRSASIASLMPGAAAPYNSPQFMQASTVVPVPAAVQSLPSSPVMQQQQPSQQQLPPQQQQQQQQQQQPQQPRSQQATLKRPPNQSANSNSLPQQQPPQQPTFSTVNGHSPQPYPDLSHRGPNPMDRAFVESQENVREGSIHSQQEKSWTRNFFGGSGGIKEKEANAELMRMIGFLTAAAPDDWNLVLEVCERASANENAAKEASRALRREFRYGEPSAQLSAARLWAIMLQNATDTFILQTASRKFLDNLEEVIGAETTSPVVRERLLDVLASAAYEYGKKPGKEGFMSLWKRVRPPWKPIEGVPFDPEDMMFDSAFPRRAVPPGQTPVPQSQQPQQQQPGQPHPDSDRDRRRKDREREKYYQRQLELAAQQQQNHTLRNTPSHRQPLRHASNHSISGSGDVGLSSSSPITRSRTPSFHRPRHSPIAHSRTPSPHGPRQSPSTRSRTGSNTSISQFSAAGAAVQAEPEERQFMPDGVLGGHLPLLNQALHHAKRWIDWEYALDPLAPLTDPIWAAYGSISGIEICRGRGSTKKLAKNDAAQWLMTMLQTKTGTPCTISDLAKELIAFHTERKALVGFGGEKIDSISPDDPFTSSPQGTEVHNVSSMRIKRDSATGYMSPDDEELWAPIKPSEKALGKQKAPVEELPDEEEPEQREEAEMEEAFIRSTAPLGSELESPKQTIHYVYDAVAERGKELDHLEKEEMERERRQREQARNSMQRRVGELKNYPITSDSAPAFDDLDSPEWTIDGFSARNKEHKPAMRIANPLPIHKASDNISNSTDPASVILNPYPSTNRSKLKKADLYESAVPNSVKSIPLPIHSHPLPIASSPLMGVSITKKNAGLRVEKESSKRTESRAGGLSMDIASQSSVSEANNSSLKKDILIGGAPPFELRRDARYSDANADAWAQYYTQGGTDPAGAVYFRSVPGIKEDIVDSQPGKGAVTTEISLTDSEASGQTISVVSQKSAISTAKESPRSSAIGGEPPFEFRPDAQYAHPNAHLWAQYYSQGGTDPAGAVYFRSVPGIKEAATTPPSTNKPDTPTDSMKSTHDSEETSSHLPAGSIHTPTEFFELERLMQEKTPLDLTGEVTIADYLEPKHGGFALVYKGVWKGKEVAVKKLKYKKNPKKPAPWEASVLRRLTREIYVWAALSHRNIAEFLGFAENFGDFPAMISTWYSQGTAKDYLDDNEDMAILVRIRLVQDVADGIDYLHRLKIIHGDLKPTNILIDRNYIARLCDFGLVRLDDWQGPSGMTTTSPYTGTERYQAPELFISAINKHPRATCEGDIYALGCIALEFIESMIPFERYRNSYDLVKAVADGEPPAPSPKELESRPVFFQYLWYVLEACWAWYPENRPKVNQVIEELALLSQLQSRPSEAQ